MENKEWKTLADVSIVRTSDPHEMIGKYIAEPVLKVWTEDFIDPDTGEVVSIEHQERLWDKGELITGDLIPKILFSIQSEEIEDVAVCSEGIRAARWISGRMRSFEVVIFTSGGEKKLLLVSATSPEAAIECCVNYIPFYMAVGGEYQVIDVKSTSYRYVESEDEDEDSDPDAQTNIEFYKVVARYRWFDEESEKPITDNYDLALRAHDVTEARNRAMAYMEKYLSNKVDIHGGSITIVKANPYGLTAVVPDEYCNMFKENGTPLSHK